MSTNMSEAIVQMATEIADSLDAGNYTDTVRASLPRFIDMVRPIDSKLADRLEAYAA